MELHKYNSYEEYKQVQTKGALKKKRMVWVQEENIKTLSNIVRGLIPNPLHGLCHGTRRGLEQKWFMENIPGCKVLGTEISKLADKFPNTIQWDFHEVKPKWIGKMDFIYSNSFDHAYDPQKAFTNWVSCLNRKGIILLEHSTHHEASSELDPFGVSLEELTDLVSKWTKKRYQVSRVLDGYTGKHSGILKLLVITRNPRKVIRDFFK